MKKRVVAFILSGIMALSMAGCGGLNGSETVIEIGDAKVTADVANFYARLQQAQYETYYAAYMGEDMWSGEAEEGKTYEESVKEGILESLEMLYILDAHKKDYDVELTEDEKKAIEDAAAGFSEANGDDEKDVVSGDKKTVQKVLELMTIQNKMYDAMVADVDTEVSDEEAAQKSMQYVSFPFSTTDEQGNTTELTDEEKQTLKASAEEFRTGAAGAADFEAYAKEKGYTASVATFDAETTSPSQTLVEAADALGEGEVTEVVEDSTGYFVAKVTSLLDREATDQKKETIVEQRKSDRYKELCEEWKKDLDIKVHKNVWKKISFVKQGVTIKDTATEETDPAEDTETTEDAATTEDTENTDTTEDTDTTETTDGTEPAEAAE